MLGLQTCSRIPLGRVSTYGNLADFLGSSPRAVGNALRRNPYFPIVPCHRVVASSFQLGGFHGSWGAASPEVSQWFATYPGGEAKKQEKKL